MNTGHDESYPGSSGGDDGYGHSFGSSEDPYTAGFASSDPYAIDSSAGDSYGTDPYGTDPYAGGAQRDAGLSQSWSQAQPAVGAHPAGQPQFGAYQPPLPSSGAAITGFVISLVSLVLCVGFLSPVGIFFSARGMKDTGPSASPLMGGRGLAIAGLVINILGILALLAWLAYIAFLIILMVIGASASTY